MNFEETDFRFSSLAVIKDVDNRPSKTFLTDEIDYIAVVFVGAEFCIQSEILQGSPLLFCEAPRSNVIMYCRTYWRRLYISDFTTCPEDSTGEPLLRDDFIMQLFVRTGEKTCCSPSSSRLDNLLHL